MAMALHLARSKHRSLSNPSILHFFSTSSNDRNNEDASRNDTYCSINPPSSSSYFGDVKPSLKQILQERPRNPTNLSTPDSKTLSMSSSLQEIRKVLSEFRRRSAVPPPIESCTTPSQSQPHISFQDLHKRNVLTKQGESNESPGSSAPGEKLSVDALRNSLRQMTSNSGASNVERKPGSFLSLSEFKESLNLKPSDDKVVPIESCTTPSQSQPHISFQELYKRNVLAKQGESNESPGSSAPGEKLSVDALRNSLRQMTSNSGASNVERKPGSFLFLSEFKESLKLKPSDDKVVPLVIGGSLGELPTSVFGREMKQVAKGGEAAMKTEFVKMYSYAELRQKLKEMRPQKKEGEGWFSFQELNERLMKLREMEEKETESRIGGVLFEDLRESLYRLKLSDDEKQKRNSIQKIDLLDHLGRTPKFMLEPSKEHLVENYFHPGNMSSTEKLKIELAKVRDEFKMSESDCGSARVQVAQLTTKIKHLSSVLHKKDKHSRKGLQAMVQKRKKLLKYLRRTDWDSYFFVLSKLGLRDNPDFKN